MNMNKKMFRCMVHAALLLLPFKVFALDVTADYKIQSDLDLSWSKVTKYRHSLDCYPKGKSNDYNDLGNELVTVTDRKTFVTAKSDWNLKSRDYNLGLGSMSFNFIKTDSDLKTDIKIQFTDNATVSSYGHIGDSDCVLREYHWRVNSHKISGQYSINIKMPPDTWLLKANVSGVGAAATLTRSQNGQTKAIQLKGDLHGADVPANKDFYIWAKPGDVVQLPIEFDIFSANGQYGELKIKLEKYQNLSAPQVAKEILKFDEYQFKNQDMDKIFVILASLAGHRDVAREVVASLGLGPIQKISNKLFGIAMGSFPQLTYELDLKSLAAASAYELALAILDSMKVFCEEKVIDLPLIGETASRPGFIIAHFWMNQNILRLNDLHFPEVRAYLEELARWENGDLTYADIAADPAEFEKLKRGFLKVRTSTNFAQDVYGDIHKSLQKIIKVFGTVGTDPKLVDDLMLQLSDLSEIRNRVNASFQSLVMGFHLNNHNLIKVTPVLAELRDLEERNRNLSKDLEGTLKFVSIDTSGEAENALDVMVRLLAHQVNIFDEPLRSPYQEPVRLAFLQYERTNLLKSSVNKCLGVVP